MLKPNKLKVSAEDVLDYAKRVKLEPQMNREILNLIKRRTLFGDDNLKVLELEDVSNTLDDSTILESEVEKALRDLKNMLTPKKEPNADEGR